TWCVAQYMFLTRLCDYLQDLRVIQAPRLVLHTAHDDADVYGTARPLLAAQAELHRARDQPEDLLVRVLVGGGVGARLHRPPDHHLLVADEHAARDLVGDLLLGQASERVKALHARHRWCLLRYGRPR